MCECNFTKIIWYKIFCIEQIQYQFSIVRSVGNSYPTCVSVFFDNDYLTVMSVFWDFVYLTVVSVLYALGYMSTLPLYQYCSFLGLCYHIVETELYVLGIMSTSLLYQYCTFWEQYFPKCCISIVRSRNNGYPTVLSVLTLVRSTDYVYVTVVSALYVLGTIVPYFCISSVCVGNMLILLFFCLPFYSFCSAKMNIQLHYDNTILFLSVLNIELMPLHVPLVFW